MHEQLRLSRQADLIPPLGDISVAIIGVGGIGSNAAHLLVSMGFTNVHLFDFDTVEEENLYPGFFSQNYVGTDKARSVYGDIMDRYGRGLSYCNDHFEDSDALQYDIILICTDTLGSRRTIWRRHAQEQCNHVYIDARMGGTLATVYAVEMADDNAIGEYYDVLADGREGELPCGEKATAPLTKGFIMGMIGQVIFDIANNKTPPFMQRYDLTHHLYLAQDEPPALEQEVLA
jgi:molybdopterin/thiamine biosynthesis adenylyltransferase